MKKLICLFLMVALLALSGCGTPVPAPAETPVPTEAAEIPAAPDDLSPILSEIRDRMHPGTAGSSLTAEELAVLLLDWCMETEMDAAQITAVTERFREGWDDEARTAFALQLAAVSGAADLLRGENGEAMLDDIGGTEGTRWPWTDAPTEKLEAIFAAAQMEELTADPAD